jgi:hypothetical protein
MEIIFKHDSEMPTCEHKFSEIMDEIINQWRNLEEKSWKVNGLATHTLPTLQSKGEVKKTLMFNNICLNPVHKLS